MMTTGLIIFSAFAQPVRASGYETCGEEEMVIDSEEPAFSEDEINIAEPEGTLPKEEQEKPADEKKPEKVPENRKTGYQKGITYTQGDGQSKQVPDTGDDSDTRIWTLLALVSLTIIISILLNKFPSTGRGMI